MSEREIGYVCGRGHYVFNGDEDYTACGSKRIAGIFVRKDDDIEFYGPEDVFDVDGAWVYSSSGYSATDFEADLDKAHESILRNLREWREGS
jgi:hypothetical protein